MILRLLCFLIFVLQCSIVYSEEIDGKALLKKGKEELDGRKYEDAIKSLSEAEKEFPLLRDYALLWLAEAYHETGNNADSLKAIRTLLKKYPDSPLIKRARIKEIEEGDEVSEENLQKMFDSFIKDYPNDTEMKFAYAKWLKRKDKMDSAKSLLKVIFIGAGPLSELAYNELCPSDIRVEDLIEKASNLMKIMDFRGAESVYRSALEKDDGTFHNEILKGLGHSLYKQKRYIEAAGVFEKANELFWKVSSLYRAGEKDAFNSALDELLKKGDKRTGSILIAVAADSRRDGDIEGAIKTYQDVMAQYPSEAEDALWGIGWTYFLTGEYKKAADIFTKLYEDYEDTKYLYWEARSLEASEKDASNLYHKLKKRERDFYSAMSYLRAERPLDQSSTKKMKASSNDIKNDENNSPLTKGENKECKKLDRIEVLFELGLTREALSELIYISKTTNSIDDILYIGSKFQDLGEYKQIVRLSEKVPYREGLHHLFYPRAYWDTVESISQKYGIDPLLILSVMREESMFNPDARSIAGALGLMQLIPQTAFWLEKNLSLGIKNTSHIYNIKNNIHLGTYYLNILMKEFGAYAYALAAYNAGEERVKKWFQKGNYKSIDEFIEDIPYWETRNYVKKVITTYFEYKKFSVGEEAITSSPENL
jgi:soluble lytic murein transglycosylase